MQVNNGTLPWASLAEKVHVFAIVTGELEHIGACKHAEDVSKARASSHVVMNCVVQPKCNITTRDTGKLWDIEASELAISVFCMVSSGEADPSRAAPLEQLLVFGITRSPAKHHVARCCVAMGSMCVCYRRSSSG